MSDRIRVLSYGGGLNSFAMLLYSIDQGVVPHYCVFADTGSGDSETWSSDGEWYGTYRHIVEYVLPICAQYGIQFKWITQADSKVRGADSLLQYFEKLRVVPTNGRNRYCTGAAKIERIERWLWETFGTTPVDVWIGFEAGEEGRRDKDPHGAKTCGQPDEEGGDSGGDGGEEPGSFPRREQGSKFQIDRIKSFPLIEAGMCRCHCEVYVRDRGFQVPRKSACWFCPYSKRGDWMKLAEQMPEQFARAAALEENQKGTNPGYKVEVITDESDGEWLREKHKFRTEEAAKARAEKLKEESGVRKVRVINVESQFIYFNTIERKGKALPSPLWENITLPYRPKVEYCPVCCRNPKATKVPGIEYLSEAEYAAYEEPLGPWVPNPWGRGLALNRSLPADEKPPTCEERIAAHLGASQVAVAEVEGGEAVSVGAENLTQHNALQWLGARLGEPVLNGALEIPLNRAEESQKLLQWFTLSTQLDRDLNPDSEKDVEALRRQLREHLDRA